MSETLTDNGVYTDLDLSQDAQITMLRQRFLRPAIAARDYARITCLLDHVICQRPDRLQERIDRIDHALNFDDAGRAQAYFAALGLDYADADAPITLPQYTALLRIALRLSVLDVAVQIARLHLPKCANDPGLAVLALRACDRADHEGPLLDAAEAVARLCGDIPDNLAEMAYLLNNRAHAKRALHLLRGINPDTHDHPGLVLQYGRALLLAAPTDPHTLHVLDRALALDPDNNTARLLVSRACLRVGKVARGQEVLDPGTDTDTNKGALPESLRAQQAEALMANGRYAPAVALLRPLIASNPGHAGWKRACVSALLLMGDTAEAEKVYNADLSSRNVSRHVSFDAALATLDGQLAQAKITPHRLDWAYDKLVTLGCPPADRPAWEARNRWVNLADHLTLDWLETRPQDARQITARIDGAQAAAAELAYHCDTGLGVFLASAHVGALFAGPLALAQTDLDYRWVASTPLVSAVPGADRLLSTFSQNRLRLARKIYGAVRQGAVVSIAIDGTSAVAARPVPFLDDTILLSDFVPRAVYQTGAKSFFPRVIWKGDRIDITLVALASPAPTDTLDGFISVWFDDFTRALADLLRTAPDNMRLSGGFWNEVRL